MALGVPGLAGLVGLGRQAPAVGAPRRTGGEAVLAVVAVSVSVVLDLGGDVVARGQVGLLPRSRVVCLGRRVRGVVLEGHVATAAGGHLERLLVGADQGGAVGLRYGARALGRLDLRTAQAVGSRRHLHFVHARRLVEAVHVALHLVQEPLLLALGDAAEPYG